MFKGGESPRRQKGHLLRCVVDLDEPLKLGIFKKPFYFSFLKNFPLFGIIN